jgi:rare lipoprotein A (peptidoglycan hydrolase)
LSGQFKLRDRRSTAMSARVRLRVAGTKRRLGRLNVYRYAHASWYGPGLYGNRLGCGGTLGTGTMGVAHKSLPCGTPVTLRHGRRSVRVRVIDRGPYVAGREYDLTAATAQRLGFSGHGAILVTR